MKILVCDSDAASRTVVRRLLMLAHGCDVTECGTGAEALDHLGNGPFDLLLLETDLPVLNGFETLALLREASEFRSLPVIMLTSDRTEESVQRAISLGVADYILKPLRVHRLQAGLRTVFSRSQTEPRIAPTSSSLTIDARTRVMLVDGDADFREFFGGLLSPYCTFMEAPSGAAALSAAWVTSPTIVFIGRSLGPVGPTALVRHLSKLGAGRFIKLATPEEMDAEKASRAYDDVIGRTLVPAVMLRDLKRFVSQGGGPLHRLLEHVPDLRSIIIKSTASTFGMMLGAEIDVVDPGDTDVVDSYSMVTMQVGESTGLRVEIQCAADLTRQLAVMTLGDDVDVATAVGVLGEIANVVTGRVQATAIERGVKCLCSLPSFGVGRAPDDAAYEDAERMVLEMAPNGSESRFRIALAVRDLSAALAEQAEAPPSAA